MVWPLTNVDRFQLTIDDLLSHPFRIHDDPESSHITPWRRRPVTGTRLQLGLKTGKDGQEPHVFRHCQRKSRVNGKVVT